MDWLGGRFHEMNKLMMMGGVALVGLTLCGATNETAACGAAGASAQTNAVATAEKKKAGNPAIERLLRERELNFAVDSDGDYKMVFETGEGRSQIVFVQSEFERYADYKTIHVFSVAYVGWLTKPMMEDLLLRRYKVGAWLVERCNETSKFNVLFAAQLPADIKATDFESCIRVVADVADALERDWSDVDER